MAGSAASGTSGFAVTAVEQTPAAAPVALVDALRRYAEQQPQLSPADRVRVLRRFVELAGYRLVVAPPVPVVPAGVTERDVRVLEWISQGRSNAEIARLLFVSLDTVKGVAVRVYRSLGARDRAHAVRRGFELGLLRPDPVGDGV